MAAVGDHAAASASPVVALDFREVAVTRVAEAATPVVAAVVDILAGAADILEAAAAASPRSTPRCAGNRLFRFKKLCAYMPTMKKLTQTSKNTTSSR